jgi:hypothetical protein
LKKLKGKNFKYLKTKENGNIPKLMGYAGKTILPGKFMEISTYIKNRNISNKLITHIRFRKATRNKAQN